MSYFPRVFNDTRSTIQKVICNLYFVFALFTDQPAFQLFIFVCSLGCLQRNTSLFMICGHVSVCKFQALCKNFVFVVLSSTSRPPVNNAGAIQFCMQLEKALCIITPAQFIKYSLLCVFCAFNVSSFQSTI